MRTHTIDITLSSDIDLRQLSCSRVRIEQVTEGRYRITSPLRLYRCERNAFIGRLLRRRRPGCQAFSGNASAPEGYFWRYELPSRPAAMQTAQAH